MNDRYTWEQKDVIRNRIMFIGWTVVTVAWTVYLALHLWSWLG